MRVSSGVVMPGPGIQDHFRSAAFGEPGSAPVAYFPTECSAEPGMRGTLHGGVPDGFGRPPVSGGAG